MPKIINNRNEIPDAPFYVLCNDTFMSGWGPARDKINVCILPCESYTDAEAVAAVVKTRDECKRIRIVTNKPRLKTDRVLYSLFNRETATAWYPFGGTRRV